ncbi:MAG: methyltransferase [Treponema sp.]|nr:methyltransferase [Treponema sp.]
MTATEIFTTRIEGIASGGAGFARFEGKSIFVEGSAPDETLYCRIIEEHRSWAKAELLEIIEASPERIQPVCAFYGICGGCNLQHINYSSQLAAKTAILGDTFKRIGGFKPPEPKVFSSNPWEYRNRMQFHRTSTNGCGLKARNSGDVIPVTDCPIADPGIRELLQNAALLSLPPEQNRFMVYARGGLLLSEGGVRRGKAHVLDRELSIEAALFFQSNGAMLESLITGLKEIVTGNTMNVDRSRPMADLYCGVGTFAAFLGEFFPHIDLVEENKSALSLARENLGFLAAARTTPELYALRDEDWVKNVTHNSPAYGFIVVDPPRQGLAPALARWLAAKGPPLLAYVSCDPATLARDSGILVKGGYELAELRFYDFYPQTSHIESLALFRR